MNFLLLYVDFLGMANVIKSELGQMIDSYNKEREKMIDIQSFDQSLTMKWVEAILMMIIR